MRIERIVNNVQTLGPGKRLCVWVNGCSRHCKGCVSERLQEVDPLCKLNLDEVLPNYRVDASGGVTVSGGEPFEQTEDLAKLVEYFNGIGIEDILIYTGYTFEELQAIGSDSVNYVLSHIAVLVDGPYVEQLNSQKSNIKGSENQRVLFLNAKFKDKYEKYMRDERKMQEMKVGNIHLAMGIPDQDFLEYFKKTEED